MVNLGKLDNTNICLECGASPPRHQSDCPMQMFIIIEHAVANTDNSDTELWQLEQLYDDFIDLVCLPRQLRPVYSLLCRLGRFFTSSPLETCGTFRLARFDEDGNETASQEPDQVASTGEGITLEKPPVARCTKCRSSYRAKAHHTGDGWALWWECACGDRVLDIAWPFGNGWTGRDTLVQAGFEIT